MGEGQNAQSLALLFASPRVFSLVIGYSLLAVGYWFLLHALPQRLQKAAIPVLREDSSEAGCLTTSATLHGYIINVRLPNDRVRSLLDSPLPAITCSRDRHAQYDCRPVVRSVLGNSRQSLQSRLHVVDSMSFGVRPNIKTDTIIDDAEG